MSDGQPTKKDLDALAKAALESLSKGDTETAEGLGDVFNLVTDFGRDVPEK